VSSLAVLQVCRRLYPPFSNSVISPPNVFAPKVNGA
jgi:hypothetical protein